MPLDPILQRHFDGLVGERLGEIVEHRAAFAELRQPVGAEHLQVRKDRVVADGHDVKANS
jgi:hypothetical protein